MRVWFLFVFERVRENLLLIGWKKYYLLICWEKVKEKVKVKKSKSEMNLFVVLFFTQVSSVQKMLNAVELNNVCHQGIDPILHKHLAGCFMLIMFGFYIATLSMIAVGKHGERGKTKVSARRTRLGTQ